LELRKNTTFIGGVSKQPGLISYGSGDDQREGLYRLRGLDLLARCHRCRIEEVKRMKALVFSNSERREEGFC